MTWIATYLNLGKLTFTVPLKPPRFSLEPSHLRWRAKLGAQGEQKSSKINPLQIIFISPWDKSHPWQGWFNSSLRQEGNSLRTCENILFFPFSSKSSFWSTFDIRQGAQGVKGGFHNSLHFTPEVYPSWERTASSRKRKPGAPMSSLKECNNRREKEGKPKLFQPWWDAERFAASRQTEESRFLLNYAICCEVRETDAATREGCLQGRRRQRQKKPGLLSLGIFILLEQLGPSL